MESYQKTEDNWKSEYEFIKTFKRQLSDDSDIKVDPDDISFYDEAQHIK